MTAFAGPRYLGAMPERFPRLFRRREVLLPTWTAVLLGLALAGTAGLVAFLGVHGFLAQHRPQGKGLLVVEGWMPEPAVREALAEFRAGSYSRIAVTGGPLPPGVACSAWGSYAELSAQLLLQLGLGPDSVAAVPAPFSLKDRTYVSGLALARWIDSTGVSYPAVDVASLGTHCRRSRRLFAAALGERAPVGVLSFPDPHYDSRRWWAASHGVKSVIGECAGYLYTALFWRP